MVLLPRGRPGRRAERAADARVLRDDEPDADLVRSRHADTRHDCACAAHAVAREDDAAHVDPPVQWRARVRGGRGGIVECPEDVLTIGVERERASVAGRALNVRKGDDKAVR